MQVVIIAGGLGTRLGELTKNIPKSLVSVGGKPFLQLQIERLKEQGIRDIVLCIGHLGQDIKDYFGDGSRFGVNLRYSLERTLLGTAGAVKNAEPLLADYFFTLYGDSYVSIDYQNILDFFLPLRKLGLMTVYHNKDLYDRSNTEIDGNFVINYSKNLKTQEMVYIDYGVNLFRKEVLKLIPEKQAYPLESVFAELIRQKQLLAYEVKERFYEIGSVSGLTELNELTRRKQ